MRTSNPIESVFATVRHRTVRMKGALSQDTARLMVFKLVMAASKTWRRLRGQNQLPKVIDGVKFRDGIEEAAEKYPPLDSLRHPLSRIARLISESLDGEVRGARYGRAEQGGEAEPGRSRV